MKYFYDTEFIEGWKKPIKWLPTIGKFNKPYHSIQLISIGIVCDDGREYYAISNEFDPSDASDWVKDNVLKPLEVEMAQKENYANRYHPDLLTLKNLLRWQGKSIKQISAEIIEFIQAPPQQYARYQHLPKDNMGVIIKTRELYGYYSDYDHVLLCSLFGTMMDLPDGFPMYTIDLKQMMDEWVKRDREGRPTFYKFKDVPDTFEMKLEQLKGYTNYPKQTNEHNALSDAKWNLELYKFLQTL